MNGEEEEILNLEEAAEYLRIKRRTLYILAAQRKVPAVKIGAQWRFQKKELRALFETGQAAPPPGEPAKSFADELPLAPPEDEDPGEVRRRDRNDHPR